MERFANFLKELRTQNGLTQVQACDKICSRREYQRYESGVTEPSMFHLRLLSSRFGYDLVAYYTLLANNNGERDCLQHKSELADLCNEGKYLEVHKKILEYQKLPLYKIFENQKMLYYYEAVYLISIQHYDHADKICMNIIQDEDPEATLSDPCRAVFSEYAINAVNILAVTQAKRGNEAKMIEISTSLYKKIEQLDRDYLSNFQDNLYRRNLHQGILFNLCVAYINASNYEEADKCVDQALDYAKKYSTMHLLPRLTRLKIRTSYALGNKETAKEYYGISKGLYHLFNDNALLEDLDNTVRTDYPDLLD